MDAIAREYGTNQYGGNLDNDPFYDPRQSLVPEPATYGPSGPAPNSPPPEPPVRGPRPADAPGRGAIQPNTTGPIAPAATHHSRQHHGGSGGRGLLAPAPSRPSTALGSRSSGPTAAAGASKTTTSNQSGRAEDVGQQQGLPRPEELYWQQTNGGLVMRRAPGPFFYEARSPTELKRRDDEREQQRRERMRERAEEKERKKAEKELRKAQQQQAAAQQQQGGQQQQQQRGDGGSGRLRPTPSFAGSLRRAFQAIKRTTSNSILKTPEREDRRDNGRS
ncbi:hypothetical protein GGR52DRAFT_213768 [Hypoxylon sp. FL1284]|nr:hypothetical protein GGR52DRAFT_213768 [Hypoxylon sp. FL1284]